MALKSQTTFESDGQLLLAVLEWDLGRLVGRLVDGTEIRLFFD